MDIVTGFKRTAVVDEHTCDACREANGSILVDVNEISVGCTSETCRCYPVLMTRKVKDD